MCNFATSSGYDRGQKIIDKGVDVFGARIEFLDDPRFYAVKIPKMVKPLFFLLSNDRALT